LQGLTINLAWSGATLRRPCLADRTTDSFGSTEFIAPDVLFKTTIVRAPKKQRLSAKETQQRVSVGPYLLILSQNK